MIPSNQRVPFKRAFQGCAGIRSSHSKERTYLGVCSTFFVYFSRFNLKEGNRILHTTCRKQTNWPTSLRVARPWMKTKTRQDGSYKSSILTLSSKNLLGSRLRISKRCSRSECWFILQSSCLQRRRVTIRIGLC